MLKYLNRGISTPVAMGIVLVVFILASSIMFQFYLDLINEDFGGGEINVEAKNKKQTATGLILYNNEEHGFGFEYPENFFYSEPEILIQECDHEIFPNQCPAVEIENSGQATGPEKKSINGGPYCLQTRTGADAGSTHTDYYYTTVKNEMCLTVHLGVRFTNCGVYGSANSVNYKNCIFENALTKPQALDEAVSTFKFVDNKLSAEDAQKIIKNRAREIMLAIKNKDMQKLSDFISPTKGVRFSPYVYVSPESDIIFSSSQLANFFKDESIYAWGFYDGSGLPINLTTEEYYNIFIYDKNFVDAENINYQSTLARGNTINNSFSIYPDSIIVEYHIPSSESGGLDWRSLMLVFEQENGAWYLAGIIHNSWTI